MKEFITLIEWARTRIASLDHFEASAINKTQFVRDFKTLHLNLGRAAGHTSFIRDNAKAGDIILTPSLYLHPGDPTYRGTKGTVVRASRLSDYGRGMTNGGFTGDIWVDEPRLAFEGMTRQDWIRIVDRMGDKSLVIMLGGTTTTGF